MKYHLICNDKACFEFLATRQLLKQMKYKPQSLRESIGLYTITGNDDLLADRVNSSLTVSTNIKNQIRFSLSNRVMRQLRPVAYAIAQKLDSDDIISICNPLHMKDADREFFKLLTEYIGMARIQNHELLIDFEDESLLNEQELALHKSLLSKTADVTLLKQVGNKAIYSGNYWLAQTLLKKAYAIDPNSPEINFSLGLCCNFFEQTQQSEYHFEKTRAAKDTLYRIKACYTLSMLFMRHHDRSLFDLNRAIDYLNEAHLLTEDSTVEDTEFQRIFNRNGYALALFRRNKTAEALEHLESGIRKLKARKANAKEKLHVSVLLYNVCQCHVAMKNFDLAKKTFGELIELDPEFPEYRIDFSRLLVSMNQHKDAALQLQKAIQIDPFIPEAHESLSFVTLEKGDMPSAQQSILEGLKYSPKSETLRASKMWFDEQEVAV